MKISMHSVSICGKANKSNKAIKANKNNKANKVKNIKYIKDYMFINIELLSLLMPSVKLCLPVNSTPSHHH